MYKIIKNSWALFTGFGMIIISHGFQGNLLGIRANISTVRTVNTVMECPEGRLVHPESLLPMIVKPSLSNIAAGLGTANIFFSKLQNTSETNEPDSKASHILGAYRTKRPRSDKKTNASPN